MKKEDIMDDLIDLVAASDKDHLKNEGFVNGIINLATASGENIAAVPDDDFD